jgi:hypothetical protein
MSKQPIWDRISEIAATIPTEELVNLTGKRGIDLYHEAKLAREELAHAEREIYRALSGYQAALYRSLQSDMEYAAWRHTHAEDAAQFNT